MRFLTSALLLSFFFSAFRSNGAELAPPRLGLIYDPASGLVRIITGVPGAAVLGPAFDSGFRAAAAITGSKGHYLLAVAEENGDVRVVRFAGMRAVAQAVPGALESPTRIVLSPSETSAALVYAQTQRIQVLTDLPDNPRILREIHTVAQPHVDAFGVSDDGTRVIAAAGTALRIFDAGSGETAVPLPDEASAVAFRAGSSEGVVTLKTGDLYRLTASGSVFRIGFAAAGAPAAVRLSHDGRRVIAAFTDGRLTVVAAETGEAASLSCDCVVEGLHELNSRGVFRISGTAPGPPMLVDVSGAVPRLWFVPVEASGSAQ